MISEIEDNNDRYRRHYNGTLFELLKGVYDYVKDGKYSQDCVDLCVDAACRILNINIGIFQNVGGLAQCINYKAERPTETFFFCITTTTMNLLCSVGKLMSKLTSSSSQ